MAPTALLDLRKKYGTDATHFAMLMIGVLIVSVAFRLNSTTPDVSWLIDMCARMVNGERAYVDIFETTPPIPVLIYYPGAWLEANVGLSAEFFVYSYTYLVYGATIWLCWRILPRQIDGLGPSHWYIIMPLAIFLFVLSFDTFAQRETFGVVLMLPIICLLITYRQTRAWTHLNLRLAAALMAGLGAAIKPPIFTLPLLLCGGYLLLTERKIRPLYSSGLIASSIAFTLISAAAFSAHHAYFDGVYQLMRDIYVPIRWSIWASLVQPHFLMCVLCVLFTNLRTRGLKHATEVDKIFLMCIGAFTAIYFYQGKYFDYHAVPIGLFAFVLVWATALKLAKQAHVTNREDTSLADRNLLRHSAILNISVFFLCLGFIASMDDDEPTLKDMTWAQSLDEPTALSICDGTITGFPIAREINAKWVNRIHCQWSPAWIEAMLRNKDLSDTQRGTFLTYQRQELDRTATVIAKERPQIIIQGVSRSVDWITHELLNRNPQLLDGYKIVAEDGHQRILMRTDQEKTNPDDLNAAAYLDQILAGKSIAAVPAQTATAQHAP